MTAQNTLLIVALVLVAGFATLLGWRGGADALPILRDIAIGLVGALGGYAAGKLPTKGE